MSSVICFNLDQSKILSFGIGLKHGSYCADDILFFVQSAQDLILFAGRKMNFTALIMFNVIFNIISVISQQPVYLFCTVFFASYRLLSRTSIVETVVSCDRNESCHDYTLQNEGFSGKLESACLSLSLCVQNHRKFVLQTQILLQLY